MESNTDDDDEKNENNLLEKKLNVKQIIRKLTDQALIRLIEVSINEMVVFEVTGLQKGIFGSSSNN